MSMYACMYRSHIPTADMRVTLTFRLENYRIDNLRLGSPSDGEGCGVTRKITSQGTSDALLFIMCLYCIFASFPTCIPSVYPALLGCVFGRMDSRLSCLLVLADCLMTWLTLSLSHAWLFQPGSVECGLIAWVVPRLLSYSWGW
ncbi:hypothetical protein BDV39DRAFT_150839 [Aspergillus sergii]|uniref:Uncharacterized protein n=1 Tax=Aspergillus sergii TaxID=1034303 RepID=A0A5N6XGA2_9EURO|nr:hypothetical protein BDV39DRAFT_150839 [Aspergillus sergii]